MTPAEFYQKQLEEFRRLFEDGGMWRALFNAVEYCHAVSIPLPDWAALAILNLIQERHFQDGRAGGYGSASGKFSMDYAHYLRWNAVKRTLGMNNLTDLPQRPPGRPAAKSGPTKAALMREAAGLLKGNKLARCSDNQTAEIEESYRLVQGSRERDEPRFRFDLLLSV